MNEANKKILSRAQDGVSTAITMLIGALQESERMQGHFDTVIKERDDAWARLKDTGTMSSRLKTAEDERDSAQKLLLAAVEARDSWASRFRGLEADMRGMESMLTDERARVKAHMQQNDAKTKRITELENEVDGNDAIIRQLRLEKQTLWDDITGLKVRNANLNQMNDKQAETIKDYQCGVAGRLKQDLATTISQRDNARQYGDRMKDQVEKHQATIGVLNTNATVMEATIERLQRERTAYHDEALAWRKSKSKTVMPAYFPVGTKVFVRNLVSGCVFQREITKVQFEVAKKDAAPSVFYVLHGEGFTLYPEQIVFNTAEAAFKN
jgi:chromosome segregation ATPase